MKTTRYKLQPLFILLSGLPPSHPFITQRPAALLPPSSLRHTTTPTPLKHPLHFATGEEYSSSLTPREKESENESNPNTLRKSLLRSLLKWPRRAVRKLIPQKTPAPGNLILIKCGESTWKSNFTFTGWADPDLTAQGIRECQHAALLLLESGYEADVIYTSVLKRAVHSVCHIQRELGCDFLPSYKTWRLNERMYGALQGLSKKETAKEFGEKVVQAWRRKYDARPPAVDESDPRYPGHDRRYSQFIDDPRLIPTTESLRDCAERTRPFWENTIKRELSKGNNVMVVAHSNSLRGLAKIIDDVDDDVIHEVTFPPGIPVVYKFDEGMNPVAPFDGGLTQVHTSGAFLEKPGLLEEALRREKEWEKTVPGVEAGSVEYRKRMTTLEKSLLKLREEKEMEQWASQFITVNKHETEQTINIIKDVDEDTEDDEGEFEQEDESTQSPAPDVVANVGQVNPQKDPVVVFVRHGQTPHNKLALFTGWEDPNLTPKGIQDAKTAGVLLRKHGFEFDVVYTSWLSRAIETAWYILDELDATWLPMIKSWRLNERHYGALTGKSKKMVANIYGDEQLKRWRRGYDIPPPQVSSYSFAYPGNDARKIKYVTDLRVSLTETICRSIEERKFKRHRKFPKAESLKSCMARTIPFYTDKIVPEAVAKGKRVLITSHENAIRGILMHLCEIPEEHMNELHLPNGLPLIYNVRRKCISLLDDGSGRDPMETYDFGSAAQYLFKPCELLEEDFYVEETKEEVVSTAKVQNNEQLVSK